MKQFILIFLLSPLCIHAQQDKHQLDIVPFNLIAHEISDTGIFVPSLKQLILKYEFECNKLVEDTVQQQGVISYRAFVAVKDERNKTIIGYTLANPDTVWTTNHCREYKFGDVEHSINGIRLINTQLTKPSLDAYRPLIINNGDFEYNPINQKQYITRICICIVKLRKPLPFSEHFWNWVKNQ